MSPEDEPFLRYNLLNFETTKGSRISCVSTYANLLALGSKAGVVFLFYFNKDWSEQVSFLYLCRHMEGKKNIYMSNYCCGASERSSSSNLCK